MTRCDILVVGAGPAGIAAAVRAAESGRKVTVLDDNPAEGGQIWRGGKRHPADSQAAAWFRRLEMSGAKVLSGHRVIGGDPANRVLHVETPDAATGITYRELILATGARELFLPFPGWTLPNVLGVGGLQALVKSGLPISGKRVVVAGSGPLLLAVAAYLRKHGADVPVICEQAPWNRLVRFAMRLGRHPAKAWQAGTLRASLAFTRYAAGTWVAAAQRTERLQSVRIQTGESFACDYLAVAFGFVPNNELPQFLGCEIRNGFAVADEFQRTSVPHVFCAGEVTGLGGVDLSLAEGAIAGYAAANNHGSAKQVFSARGSAQRFAHHLNEAFALRDELRAIAQPDTLVCRCEEIQSANSWRSAKLHHRCGMGPCQGRICGPAVEFIQGWKPESVRPPVFPARVASLLSESEIEEGIYK